MKTRFWKIAKWFALIFILMFAGRMIYGFTTHNTTTDYDGAGEFFSSVTNLRKNYASEKVFRMEVPQSGGDFRSSQKYEKSADVKSKTGSFEKDEAAIKAVTKDFNGVVQYEQNTGNKGNREIHLMIGVDPVKFDSFYVRTQHIGVIRSTVITKVDKTTEYRQLNARKASLEKTLASLNELKSKTGVITAGVIADFIALHDKILDTETQLQGLGVELGNFAAENELCTIRFSLYERESVTTISFFTRVKVALEWTLQYYAIFIFCVVATSIGAFILLLIVDRLKLMKILSEN